MVVGARQTFQCLRQKKPGFLEIIDLYLNIGIRFYITIAGQRKQDRLHEK